MMVRRLNGTILVLGIALALSGCAWVALLNNGVAIAAISGYSYPIVDTNQTKTYGNTSDIAPPAAGTAFYGQDAQFTGNQPRYVDNGDGTVTDLVTGLMWQQAVGDKVTYDEAVAGADSFDLAGYTDWRLPTIKELYSLMDFSGEDMRPESRFGSHPFINTNYFDFEYGDTSAGERIIDSQWATSTTYTGESSVFGKLMFGVNFADGRIKGYPTGALQAGADLPVAGANGRAPTKPAGAPGKGPVNAEKTFFVRYVRGNTAYGENDFVDNGDGTVSDFATGLMWSRGDSGHGMNWEDALAYVQELNEQYYLGCSDWRLPDAKELQSIVDYERSPDATDSAAIDPVFNATSIINEAGEKDWPFYWTSTSHVSESGAQEAVYIAFGRGLGCTNGHWSDVHGAGCQRSDPKSGYASQYPTGRGPQGDAVRILNYVRAVRDIDG